MVYWQNFDPEEFELEFNEQELTAHKVSIDEATEVIVYEKRKGLIRGHYRMGFMKSRKQTEAELERQLIADADNPDAWEEEVTVPASTSPRPAWYGQSKKLSRATHKPTRRRKHASGKRSIPTDKSRAA